MGKYSNDCTNFLCCIDKDGDSATMGVCQSGESELSVEWVFQRSWCKSTGFLKAKHMKIKPEIGGLACSIQNIFTENKQRALGPYCPDSQQFWSHFGQQWLSNLPRPEFPQEWDLAWPAFITVPHAGHGLTTPTPFWFLSRSSSSQISSFWTRCSATWNILSSDFHLTDYFLPFGSLFRYPGLKEAFERHQIWSRYRHPCPTPSLSTRPPHQPQVIAITGVGKLFL